MKAPTEMPETGAATQDFELQRVDYQAPEAGGYIGGVQAGFPLWQATWALGKLGEDRSDDWRAWHLEQRGAIRRFYARDLRRPYPRSYPEGFTAMTRAAGAPFLGDATDWSATIDANEDCQLSLEGLPAGFVMGKGDYVGFRWDQDGESVGNMRRRALVRVTRFGGGTADEDGNLTVQVEPPVPDCVPVDAVAHLDRPACVMVLISSQTKLEPIDRSGGIRGGTIVAVQDLRP